MIWHVAGNFGDFLSAIAHPMNTLSRNRDGISSTKTGLDKKL
jgi:hypothetical protein